MEIQLKEWVLPTGVGVASFIAGIGAGYAFKTYRAKKAIKAAELAKEEVESTNVQLGFEFDERTRTFNHAMQEAAVVIKRVKEIEGVRLRDPELDNSVINHPSNGKQEIIVISPDIEEDDIMINVFPDDNDNWDYDEEVKGRSPEYPYIIHRDEYFSNEMDFSQSSLMFYEGDNILCDEQDVPVYNPDKVVGRLIFGHGSQDPSIVYVRNEHLQAEYEVIIDHGYYQSEILGHQPDSEPDLKHSHTVRKFRME